MATIPTVDEYGAKPLSISWSRLYEFEKCHQRLAFHMDGKGETVKDGRRFIHGTLADMAMRRWLDQDEPQLPGQMVQYVDELWEEVVENNPEYQITWKGNVNEDKAYVRNIAKTVVGNLEPFLLARVIPFDYEPEFRFKVPLQVPDSRGFARTIILNGGMDIAVRDNNTGKIFLYDLKATTNENYIHSGIMPQLIFYSIAWTAMFGTKPEDITCAFLTPACKIQYHELEVSSESRRHLMTRILRCAHALWDQEKPICTTNNSECFFCDCKKICPRWADAITDPQDGKMRRVSLTETAKNRRAAKEEAATEKDREI